VFYIPVTDRRGLAAITEHEDVTKEKILESLNSPIVKALDGEAITPRYLAKKLKSELNARETKVIKAHTMKKTPDTTGADGKIVSGKIIEVDELFYSKPLVAWDVRQKARQDAHRLRSDYPAEKKQITGADDGPIELVFVPADPKAIGRKGTSCCGSGNGGDK
jgi:hypothetical protein